MRLSIAFTALTATFLPLAQSATIWELVQATDVLSTLESAIELAGLEDALSGENMLTAFAPPNSAFEDLGTAAPELAGLLLTPPWKQHLTNVLLFHVTGGAIFSGDLTDGPLLMLSDENATVTAADASLTDAYGVSKVITETGLFDLAADNGAAHVIDRVLLPVWAGYDIVVAGEGDPDMSFSIVIGLLKRVDLYDTLKGYGSPAKGYTLFAPVNSAFDGIDPAELTDEALTDILLNHVVSGPVHSSTLASGPVEMLNGKAVDVIVSDTGVTIGAATVTEANVFTNNGFVHIIDTVLIPATEEPEDSASSTASATLAAMLMMAAASTLM